MGRLARRHQKTVSQIVFRFALDAGIIPLTGTTSRVHMQADLDVFKFSLSPGEVARIEGLALR
jgi:diketogulonate reductase-like aldo/keto reductase